MVKTKTKKSVAKSTRKKPAARSRATVSSGAIAQEADGIYLLKLVLYLILGTQWLRITKGTMTVPIPVGLLIGLLFARTEKFALDRKLEYLMLLLAMFVGFWLPIGLELVL